MDTFILALVMQSNFPLYLRNPIKTLWYVFTSGIEKTTFIFIQQRERVRARQALIK